MPILRDYPTVANKFLTELSLVEAHQEIAKKDYPQARICDGQEIIMGSERRSPETFWVHHQHQSGGKEVNNNTEEEAIPVTAMIWNSWNRLEGVGGFAECGPRVEEDQMVHRLRKQGLGGPARC